MPWTAFWEKDIANAIRRFESVIISKIPTNTIDGNFTWSLLFAKGTAVFPGIRYKKTVSIARKIREQKVKKVKSGL